MRRKRSATEAIWTFSLCTHNLHFWLLCLLWKVSYGGAGEVSWMLSGCVCRESTELAVLSRWKEFGFVRGTQGKGDLPAAPRAETQLPLSVQLLSLCLGCCSMGFASSCQVYCEAVLHSTFAEVFDPHHQTIWSFKVHAYLLKRLQSLQIGVFKGTNLNTPHKPPPPSPMATIVCFALPLSSA